MQAKTTVILPQKKKLMSIVVTGGSVRIWWIPTRCRQGIDLTSRKHCRHCTASRKRRTRNTMKIGRTVPPHGGSGKHPGGIHIMRPYHKDGLNTDRTVKPVVISESSIYLWHESHYEFGAQFTVIISVTVNAVHRHRRGGVKSTSPVTENSRQKWLRISGQQQELHHDQCGLPTVTPSTPTRMT